MNLDRRSDVGPISGSHRVGALQGPTAETIRAWAAESAEFALRLRAQASAVSSQAAAQRAVLERLQQDEAEDLGTGFLDRIFCLPARRVWRTCLRWNIRSRIRELEATRTRLVQEAQREEETAQRQYAAADGEE